MDITQTDTVSQDITETGTISTDVTISKALSKDCIGIFGIGGSVEVTGDGSATKTKSETHESNWNNGFSNSQGSVDTKSSNSGHSRLVAGSSGRSSSQTLSHGSSSTQDNRIVDSVSFSRSVSRQAAHSNARTAPKTKRDSESYRVDESYASNNENSLTNSINEEKRTTETITSEKSKSSTYSVSVSIDETFKIMPGTCKILACLPQVISMVVPFECLGSDNKTSDIVPTEIMFITSSSKIGNLILAIYFTKIRTILRIFSRYDFISS